MLRRAKKVRSNESRIREDSLCGNNREVIVVAGEPPNLRCGAFAIAGKGSMRVGRAIEAAQNTCR